MSIYWISNTQPWQDIYWSNLSLRMCASHFSTNIDQFCLNEGDHCWWLRSDHPDDSLHPASVWPRIHKCGLMYQAICLKMPLCSIAALQMSKLLLLDLITFRQFLLDWIAIIIRIRMDLIMICSFCNNIHCCCCWTHITISSWILSYW